MTTGAIRPVLAGAIACAMAVGVAAGARLQRPVQAMYVRSQQVALAPDSADKLLEFCRLHRIELLFVAAPELKPNTQEKWRRFLAQAHQRGVRVHALAGEGQWGVTQDAASGTDARGRGPKLATGRSLALQHVGQVIVHNSSADPTERFDGVHHDIPVWDTDEYAGAGSSAAKATILGNYVEQLWGSAHYLTTLGSVAVSAGSEQPVFGTSIPAELDEATTWGKQGQYKQAALPASQQVVRTTDYTVLMTAADTADAILAAASELVRFAGLMERQAFIGVRTTPVGDAGADATFGDTGQAGMETVLAEVSARLRTEPGFAGIAIDGYSTYAAMQP